jgi:3-dehydrosphinganine reductase
MRHWEKTFIGKRVIVTGASSGIGYEICSQLVKLGSSIIMVARNEIRLSEAAIKLKKDKLNSDIEIIPLVLDVSNLEDVNEKIGPLLQKYRVDYLINAAGISIPGYAMSLTDKEISEVMNTNYFGALWMIRAVLPHFRKQNSGYIVNVSSIAGVMGYIGYLAYGPSKAALINLSEVLHNELCIFNIGVSVVIPSDVNTAFLQNERKLNPPETTAISRLGKVHGPDSVARAILKGVSKNRFMILPSTDVKILIFFERHFRWLVKSVLDLIRKKSAQL